MFSKLRFRLTLINVLVVILITSFFMVGVYFLMADSLYRQSDQMMQLIASDVGSSVGNPPAKSHQQRWFTYFFVKVDQAGKILENSPNMPISSEQEHYLISQVLKRSESKGQINQFISDLHFRFFKAPLKSGQGYTLVFFNTEAEEEIIGHLLGAFTLAGLAGAVLALLGGVFMANRSLIPIRQSWERQKNFIADASHELRTPVTVIQTNLDVIKANPEEKVADQALWLENIEAENHLLAKLVDDLLFLARADSNQQMINFAPLDFSQAVKEAAAPFAPMAKAQEKMLSLQLAEPSELYGDQRRLKQLIAILIDNAIKYSPAASEIELKLIDNPHHIQLSVTNAGEGIAEEHLDKVFDRFYRVDKARSRESGGTGLGLSIADWIVKEHHGSIKVSSQPQQSTTFTVTLPKNLKHKVAS